MAIRFSLTIDGTPVDLFNDESIPLTRQLKDLMNLSTIWTDYTKDFQIPASDTNNEIFANWFDENMVIVGWNPNIGKDATIFIHGLPVFEGRVELIGCKFKDGLPQLYNIIFYGTTKKILDAWGETLMNEVDWSAYNTRRIDATTVVTHGMVLCLVVISCGQSQITTKVGGIPK
jgi:hypothetical protein